MSDLLHRQQDFFRMTAIFFPWLITSGYEVTYGEVQRSKAQAAMNAAAGTGISNSLHLISLAVDLNLFKDGKFLTTKEEYQHAGEYWEDLGGSWGGRFKNVDADHFSLSFNGVR